MEQIEILKKAINRKHRCDPSHEALNTLERAIEELVVLWNDLPDEVRLDREMYSIGMIIRDIGGK